MRKIILEWIAQSCNEGKLVDNEANRLQTIDSAFVPGARIACQEAATGMNLDDVFYNRIADIECIRAEQKLWKNSRVNQFLKSTIGLATNIDEVADEMKEGLLFQCNEFRNGRISGRDTLYNQARIWREFQKEGMSTFWRDIWFSLTWPFKLIVGLLGILATVVGIIAGLKKILSK
jgi:hypothetical protein